MGNRNPWLCLAIVVAIAAMGLVATGGTTALAVYGREPPQILGYVIAGAIGALSSFLVSPPRGSIGMPDQSGGNQAQQRRS